MNTLYVLPTADTNCYDEYTNTDCWSFSREVMLQEIAKAELRGREAMRQECADHVFNMAQWDENNEQWVVLHRASTAIRNIK